MQVRPMTLAASREREAPSGLDCPCVSVIVPTYREAVNLPTLVERIEQMKSAAGLKVELLVMDDNSRDGTEEVVRDLRRDWVRLVVRTTDRGLSQAVMEGLSLAQHPVFVVMDADLSHPPEKIPAMLGALDAGADFVIGSRYISGGSTDAAWGLFRWVNSKVATLLARPLTGRRVRDPMAGFFALRREMYERAGRLNPVGYKIGLELLVKCGCKRVQEVPIFFAERVAGESKLTVKEQVRYLRHVAKLLVYKFGWRS